MLSNKDRIALGRISKALEENARADKGKEAKVLRTERKAWEKAAGGVKKLAEAGTVRAAADEYHASQVVSGDAYYARIINDAKADARRISDDLDERDRELAKNGSSLDKLREVLALKSQELENEARSVKGREVIVDQRLVALDRTEAEFRARETDLTGREAEVERRARKFEAALA